MKMTKFQRFSEYLDAKGKLKETPKEDKKADYAGPQPKNPSGDNGFTPYKNGKDVVPSKPEKGLADEGPKELVYNPKIDEKEKMINDIPSSKNTSKFVAETNSMSPAEFNKYVLSNFVPESINSVPGIKSYSTGVIHPHPPEVNKYIASLVNENNRIVENLIFEFQENNNLEILIKELFSHKESLDIIKKLYEGIRPPVGLDDEFSDDEDDEFSDDEEPFDKNIFRRKF